MKSPAYRRGYKDMNRLIAQKMSYTFLVQFTFALGFCRKDKHLSEKSCFHYCDGFNDRLDEYLDEKGMERVDMKSWWCILRGKVHKKIVKGKEKKVKVFQPVRF